MRWLVEVERGVGSVCLMSGVIPCHGHCRKVASPTAVGVPWPDQMATGMHENTKAASSAVSESIKETGPPTAPQWSRERDVYSARANGD